MRRTGWKDGALAAGLAATACAEFVSYSDGSARHVAGALVVIAGAISLAWRRVAPVPVAVLGGAGLVVPAVLSRTTETISGPIVVMIATYAVAAYGPGLPLSLVPTGAVLGAVVLRSFSDWGPEPVSVGIGIATILASFALGLMMRGQRRAADMAAERATAAELARDWHAAEAVAAERARIARDLHDVVAHAISVIVLQARGGRRMLAVDPDESRTAFNAVEMLAEQAMTELRRMLGVIREDDIEADLTPRPSLRHLDALIARLARPDLRLVTDITGDLTRLPPGVDVAAYRIIQESLTNVLRHAAATTASLAVRVGPIGVEIEVADDGNGDDTLTEPGYGLLGMRERVALYGGTFSAGAGPGGGFRVAACLPVTA
jgi:signal transduction histidine kinase